jgi:NTE family protein
VLSPVTFNNYGGHCGFEFPPWVREVAATRSADADIGRALRPYNELQELENSEARPYLHLVDGGVSDNVAMRAIVELLQTVDVSRTLESMPVLREVRRIAVIVVNAVSSPSVNWGRIESPPGLFDQLFQASSVPIDRYSYESVELLNDIVARWALERKLASAQARLSGTSETRAELSRPAVELYAIDVSFNQIADPGERHYFENLTTSFVLQAEAADRLRDIAARLLRASPQYQRLVDTLGGDPR